MGILFDNRTSTFTLQTKNTTYQMQVTQPGYLMHLYYGRKTTGDCLDYRYVVTQAGFSPNPYAPHCQHTASMDLLTQEYSSENTGDFRLSALEITMENGAFGTDLRYLRHQILPGKYRVKGMPSSFAQGGEAQTLLITLEDAASRLQVDLLYGVFEEKDVITRAVRLRNAGRCAITLRKAASLTLDLPFGQWDLMHFFGRHCMERQAQRTQLMQGIQTVASRRGASSHHHNPFVILCDRGCCEDYGNCIGFMLVYSASHRTDIEVDQMHSVRVVMGIHDESFSWELAPGETFYTPEVLLTYSHRGLTALSQTYHRFLRQNIIRSQWNHQRRPVLINNWEATYYQYTADKILTLAQQASELGVELFVLDDGWFANRNDDTAGLGDWFVNEEKLPGGLLPLIKKIGDMGMQFGIWIEPEMVSEDSLLYRAHPDWALTVPDRKPALSRNQLVLDFANPEVVDYLYQQLSRLLRNNPIAYVKWDMNRNMTDVYSKRLPANRQGEVIHRYILGVYDLLERLNTAFPNVLFEGCAGGGGRFDAGMLYYFPQIWCSDDTDAIERMTIQYGTSYGYPICTVGAHVSACPNHQTGRSTPLGTRALVAMAGTFGYELDPGSLCEEEREQIKQQISRFHRYYDLIQNGDYYRLTAPGEQPFMAWEFAQPDGGRVLFNLVVTHTTANSPSIHFCLKGLDPNGYYRVEESFCDGCEVVLESIHMSEPVHKKHRISGSSLMYAGYTLPAMQGDYPCLQLLFVRQ